VAGGSESYKLFLTDSSAALSNIRSAILYDQARASETHLSSLAQDCELLTVELERLLVKIEEPGNDISFRNRLRRATYQKEFDQLAQRIERLRNQVHIVVSTLLL
jgi:peptidoglycan hydrolase CwlO-like protein